MTEQGPMRLASHSPSPSDVFLLQTAVESDTDADADASDAFGERGGEGRRECAPDAPDAPDALDALDASEEDGRCLLPPMPVIAPSGLIEISGPLLLVEPTTTPYITTPPSGFNAVTSAAVAKGATAATARISEAEAEGAIRSLPADESYRGGSAFSPPRGGAMLAAGGGASAARGVSALNPGVYSVGSITHSSPRIRTKLALGRKSTTTSGGAPGGGRGVSMGLGSIRSIVGPCGDSTCRPATTTATVRGGSFFQPRGGGGGGSAESTTKSRDSIPVERDLLGSPLFQLGSPAAATGSSLSWPRECLLPCHAGQGLLWPGGTGGTGLLPRQLHFQPEWRSLLRLQVYLYTIYMYRYIIYRPTGIYTNEACGPGSGTCLGPVAKIFHAHHHQGSKDTGGSLATQFFET